MEMCYQNLTQWIYNRNRCNADFNTNPSEVRCAKWKFLDICSGLEYIHDTWNMIHGNLKPANILITARNVAKVTDFAIYQDRECNDNTKNDVTSFYQAPEQAQNQYGREGDIFAAGIQM